MPDANNNAAPIDPLFQAFLEQWTRCVHEAGERTQARPGRAEGRDDLSAWRRQWFDSLDRSADLWLRSPLFLQMMKAQIDALARTGQTKEPHDAVDSLAARVDDVERAMQSHREEVERRLQVLESQVGSPVTAPGFEQFLGAPSAPKAESQASIGATPHEVVYQDGSLRLLRYQNPLVRFAEPILICFALVNRPYILDLQGDRSVVRRLLDRGFDVYLIDWGVPADADRTRQLQDYVCRLLRDTVDFVCARAQSPQLNLLGYCMGGTMATMFTALYPERVRNLILLAAPIDFGGDDGLLNVWSREEYFDVDRLIDAFGNCPGEFLQYCFQLMKPVQNFAEKYLTLCENLDDGAFLDNFLAVERWANDSIPVAGETFREYVKLLYQQNRLVKGELSLGGVPVRLEAITCPLLLLVAEQDHLVPPSSTLAIEHYVQFQ